MSISNELIRIFHKYVEVNCILGVHVRSNLLYLSCLGIPSFSYIYLK